MKKLILLISALFFLIGSLDAYSKGKETNYRNSISFAYSPVNSVFEDDNIILEIYNGSLWAKNKTEKTIFIDLSQCFLINNGASYPMYTPVQDEKKASKAKLSTANDEFLSIAPATGSNQNPTRIVNFGGRLFGTYSSAATPSQDFSEYDKRFLNLINDILTESLEADPKGKEYLGTVKRHLTEEESIHNLGASIAYAFNKRAEDWTSVTISTWVSDIVFAPYFIEKPKALSKKEKSGFGVKESEKPVVHIKGDSPFEFDEDKSPIIVADWEGDYKKGKFDLRTLYITTGGVSAGRAIAGMFTAGLAFIGAKPLEIIVPTLLYEGDAADWGKMNYTKFGDTKQEGK